MAGFVVLQLIFDGILLFAILFLFHYAQGRAQRKKDDESLLKSLEVEEIKQDLQELLVTLKQVGSEASEGIQQKVREAEAKTKRLRELLKKTDSDLERIERLSRELEGEKQSLDERRRFLQAGSSRPATGRISDEAPKEPKEMNPADASRAPLAFSTESVREIYRMADASVDISEIARKMKLTRGEIQLILNLRSDRFSTPN